jgi:pyrroline-5-carboxylate reductase
MTQLGIIGTGSLGTALLRAASKFAPEIFLVASSREPSRIETLRHEIPALKAATPEKLASECDLVLLCVSPEAYLPLVDRIAGHLKPRTILVSVTNSVSLETIGRRVAVPVVKIIPTMAHIVGRGNVLLIAGPLARSEHMGSVAAVFARFSKPIVIDPSDDRAASNISGSALALFAALADSFVTANASRATKLDRRALDGMMTETLGAIATLMEAGYSWSEIVRTTATRGGMTEAALNVMMSQFPEIASGMVDVTFAKQAEIQSRDCASVQPAS